jgi:DNA-binding PadR family transcriptional regulator
MSEKAMQEPAFLVLTALAGGPLHGYGLVQDVIRVSDGRVRLHTGTLYALLDRLREAGLVEVDHEEIVESRLRRYYALTGAGAERLAAEAERLRSNASAATARLRWLAGGQQRIGQQLGAGQLGAGKLGAGQRLQPEAGAV